MQCSADS